MKNAVYLGRTAGPPGLKRVASGKVRDVFELDARHRRIVTEGGVESRRFCA